MLLPSSDRMGESAEKDDGRPADDGPPFIIVGDGDMSGGGRLGAPLNGFPAYSSRHCHNASCAMLKNNRDLRESRGG
jgi:hypothetical protein